MADIANTVASFLTLATTWYKSAAARNTASATLNNHLKNFDQYHGHISSPIESLFVLNDRRKQDPLIINQAARVLHLEVSLSEWLMEAGFIHTKHIFEIVRRGRRFDSSERYIIRRRQNRQTLVLPIFGLTEKEVAFITLFEKLKEAYEKLEDKFPSEVYRSALPPVMDNTSHRYSRPQGTSLRGGYNSEVESEGEETDRVPYMSHADRRLGPDANRYRSKTTREGMSADAIFVPADFQTQMHGPVQLTKRQKLRQEQMLQDLSERLERNIGKMMISNGDHKGLRKRRRQREPLEDAHREVLREKSLEAKRAETQLLQRETNRTVQKLDTLRRRRTTSQRDEIIDLDVVEHDSDDEAIRIERDSRAYVRPRMMDEYRDVPYATEREADFEFIVNERAPRPHVPHPDVHIYEHATDDVKRDSDNEPHVLFRKRASRSHVPHVPHPDAHIYERTTDEVKRDSDDEPHIVYPKRRRSGSNEADWEAARQRLEEERERAREQQRRSTAERKRLEAERRRLEGERKRLESERRRAAADNERATEGQQFTYGDQTDGHVYERRRRRATTDRQAYVKTREEESNRRDDSSERRRQRSDKRRTSNKTSELQPPHFAPQQPTAQRYRSDTSRRSNLWNLF